MNSSWLNPRNKGYSFFAYGSLPVSLVRAAGEAANRCDYSRIVLPGRFLSASANLITVFACFLLGLRALRSRAGGLASAALYGFAVLAIQHAHFMVVDSFATLFVTLSLLALVEGQRRSSLWRWACAGAFWGLAMACKLSVYSFIILPVLLAAWQSRSAERGARDADAR